MTPELYHIFLKTVILFSRPDRRSITRWYKALSVKMCEVLWGVIGKIGYVKLVFV